MQVFITDKQRSVVPISTLLIAGPRSGAHDAPSNPLVDCRGGYPLTIPHPSMPLASRSQHLRRFASRRLRRLDPDLQADRLATGPTLPYCSIIYIWKGALPLIGRRGERGRIATQLS